MTWLGMGAGLQFLSDFSLWVGDLWIFEALEKA